MVVAFSVCQCSFPGFASCVPKVFGFIHFALEILATIKFLATLSQVSDSVRHEHVAASDQVHGLRHYPILIDAFGGVPTPEARHKLVMGLLTSGFGQCPLLFRAVVELYTALSQGPLVCKGDDFMSVTVFYTSLKCHI